MLSELLLASGIVLIVYAFYKWATPRNDYFAKRNLPFEKPTFLLGNTAALYMGKYTTPDFVRSIYDKFPNEKLYGLFDFRVPMVVVRDAELLKQLAVKDFDHFEDHRLIFDDSVENLFTNSLFALKGERWRDMRATLSPAFTGSKMRQMFEFVSECADDMTQHFLKTATATGKNIELEMKDFFTRYTNDVIATCAFGIRVNSFENPKNEFYESGRRIMNLAGPIATIKFLLSMISPKLLKTFNISLFPKDETEFFSNIILETMDERKKRNIFRPDMINILMQVRQGKLSAEAATEQVQKVQDDSAGFATVEESEIGKKVATRKWTDDELIAQAFLFFVAGFDSTSNMLLFLSYDLCVNPDIQEKLYDEIAAIASGLDGKRITYDALQKMKYLDQVVCESMRKWPGAPMTDRLCVRDYVCQYGDNKEFHFEKGLDFWIPIQGFHYDPKYFPDPEKFDPERFSDENKDNIVPGTYLPFGIGPRNCIGSRFALMEIKAIVYYILLNFKLMPNAKTQIPLKLKKIPFAMVTEKGIHLDFQPRQK